MDFKKRMLYDNDGGDILRAEGPTYEEFIQPRHAPLVGSGITTVAYCGFGAFGVVQYPDSDYAMTPTLSFAPGRTSQAPEIIRRGDTPYGFSLRFCREHGLESFFGFRMNDMHDSANPFGFQHNEWKQSHLDCLIAPDGNKPPFGGAYAVNYRCQPVRDTILGVAREVCERFDTDGIFLDFFRHPVFFPSVAYDGRATAQDTELMTDLVRRIRGILREAGERRGRKLELAVRTPDSLAYSLLLGLDLETWMREGLIDDFLPAGYVQLNFWDYSAALGHRYGVNVYPSIDEPRVANGDISRDNPINLRRADEAGMRGRVRNAAVAGCDGVMFFNWYAKVDRLSVITDAQASDLPRRYALSARGNLGVCHNAPDNSAYTDIPKLCPMSPEAVAGDYMADFFVGECSHNITGTLKLYLDDPCEPLAALNGEPLEGAWRDGAFSAPVPGRAIRPGVNRLYLYFPVPATLLDITLDVENN